MGSQGSPLGNEGLYSPIHNDRYTHMSPRQDISDKRSPSYHESIDHSIRNTERSESRSRSRERRSPPSASHRRVLNHDQSSAGRGDMRRAGPEWKSRSPADRGRERRTREAEEYKISRGLKGPNFASRLSPDERSKQHGMLHLCVTTPHFTALDPMPSSL